MAIPQTYQAATCWSLTVITYLLGYHMSRLLLHINKTQSELEQQILSRTSKEIVDLEEETEGKVDTVRRQLESARSGLQSSLTNLNTTVSSDLHVVRGDIHDAEESITELQSYHPATLGKLFLALSVENHWELTALQVTLHLILLKIIAES